MTNTTTSKSPSGMTAFTIVWAGQLVSVLASSMTQFALTIWAYQETGSALALGAVNTFFLIPFLLLSPIAGAMVDRYNRKVMMMVSDLTAVLATMGLLSIHATVTCRSGIFMLRRSSTDWEAPSNGPLIRRRSAPWCASSSSVAPTGCGR